MTEWGLQEIKSRYFFPGITDINGQKVPDNAGVKHHSDCAIFRSTQVYDYAFCSCGLLHDLNKSLGDSGLIEIIYPRYNHDVTLQERGDDTDDETVAQKEEREREREECRRILIEIFGPPPRKTLTDIKKKYEEDAKVLKKIFGKQYPLALVRLDERLKVEIASYRRASSPPFSSS